ncbi:MAG TPA: RNase adapter RapZ [Ferruginibacter sp.]|nr:RNase adapter RapZ [Ferruginibacter sp.]
MQVIIKKIEELFKANNNSPVTAIDKLPQAGSDRFYFRISTGEQTYIATYGPNVPENESFIYFSQKFKEKSICTPQVYYISEDKTIYIQEDFGDTSLLNILEAEGFSDNVYSLYKQSLSKLAELQIKAHEVVDYSKCLTNREFGKEAIMADLLYFKFYFLDALAKPYDKQLLIHDFEALSNYLAHTEHKYFMFRDFQSRNIMVTPNNEVHFIDYQGGMNGAPQYDVASMLWQARAGLSEEWKGALLNDYMDAFEKLVGGNLNRTVFRSQYYGYVLIRLLQVLGAYGFRGLFERKAQFLTSIPMALSSVKWFLQNHDVGIAVPTFRKVLDICISDEVIAQFTPIQATTDTALVVTVNSFSYKKGIPVDSTENGGGFVFDMRGILNPGRFDEYKKLSGLDKSVKDFLEQRTKMPVFLNSVFDIVDISVSNYIERGFASLAVNFGCTGGQHRSVYAAEAMARHLKNKFKVKVELTHTNRENWVR